MGFNGSLKGKKNSPEGRGFIYSGKGENPRISSSPRGLGDFRGGGGIFAIPVLIFSLDAIYIN